MFCLEDRNIHSEDEYSHLILFRITTTYTNNDLGSSEFQDPQGLNAIKYDISLVFFVDNPTQYYRSQENPMSRLKRNTQPNCPYFCCLLEVLVGMAHAAVDASTEYVVLS